MRTLLDLPIALTRAWAAVYTRGLPYDVGGERREEKTAISGTSGD